MRLVDPDHPALRPLWRRVLLVAAPFAWAGVEWSFDNRLWAYVFAGIGGVLAWHLLPARPRDDRGGEGGGDGD